MKSHQKFPQPSFLLQEPANSTIPTQSFTQQSYPQCFTSEDTQQYLLKFHQQIAHSHQSQKAYWMEIYVDCQVRFSCYDKDGFSFQWCHYRPSFRLSHLSEALPLPRFQRWDLCLKSNWMHLDCFHPCLEVLLV